MVERSLSGQPVSVLNECVFSGVALFCSQRYVVAADLHGADHGGQPAQGVERQVELPVAQQLAQRVGRGARRPLAARQDPLRGARAQAGQAHWY